MEAPLHDPVFDFHVARQVPLQGEFAGAVEALEGFAVRVQVHVAHQVVHAVEFLPTQLPETVTRRTQVTRMQGSLSLCTRAPRPM